MRLLLAEDEKELSKALCTVLKYNNYTVDAVYNGQDALDYLSVDVYDCLILDIMMPKIDGIEVLKKIRKNGNNIPVLMLTAKSEIDDKCLGLDLGADDYLTKPFSTKELLSRIKALIRRKTEIVDDVLTFGDVTLNRSTYELKSAKGAVILGNKEFQMLEFMMLSPKKNISVEQFMDKIWDVDSDAEMNVVWVNISYLRKKLKIIGSAVEIKSNRNVGYYLENEND